MNEFSDLVLKLLEASENHEYYRDKECINLIASEGLKSPAVKQLMSLSADLEGRYAEGENDLEGHVKKRYYQGQKYMKEIENHATDLMKRLFNCDWADIRLVSGTHANLATFKGLSLTSKNRKMVVTPLSCGAHISHDYAGLAGSVLGLENINHVYNINEFNIDPDKSANVIRAAKPGIVTFGGSLFLFPHPIKELKNVAKEVGLTFQLKSNVVMVVSTGKISIEARKYANQVMSSTNLNIVLLNSNDLHKIAENPTQIVEALNREARSAMKIKKLELF